MIIRLLTFYLLLIGSLVASAEEENLGSINRLLLIDYDSLSSFALGDGIDYEKLYSPAGNCIDMDNSEIKQDTPGAVLIKADIDVISTSEDIERSLNKSLAVSVGLNGSMGDAFSADLKGSMSETYDWYMTQSSSSLLIRVKLYADYGRDVLDYKIKESMKKLLDGERENIEEFISICGTHFIRAVQKEASLTVDLRVSNLSKDEKKTLTKTANAELKGSGTFSNGLKIGGNASVNDKLVSFEKIASQFGSLNLSVYGSGAPGFKNLGNTIFLEGDSKSSIKNYLDKLSVLAEEFDRTDGAPKKYIVLKYPQLPDSFVNYSKYLKIESLTRRYLEMVQFSNLYERIKRDDINFYNRHFEEPHESVSSQISLLRKQLDDCANNSDCTTKTPSFYEYPDLENLLQTIDFQGECSYYTPVVDGGESKNVMSDFALVWRGIINFPNHVQLNSIKAFRLSESGVLKDLDKFRADRDFSVDPNVLLSDNNRNVNPKGPGRAISQIMNERIPKNILLKSGGVNATALRDLRNELASSIFGFRFLYKDGREFTQLVGKPNMSLCALVK